MKKHFPVLYLTIENIQANLLDLRLTPLGDILGFIRRSGLMHKQNRHPFSWYDFWSAGKDLGPSFIPFLKTEV